MSAILVRSISETDEARVGETESLRTSEITAADVPTAPKVICMKISSSAGKHIESDILCSQKLSKTKVTIPCITNTAAKPVMAVMLPRNNASESSLSLSLLLVLSVLLLEELVLAHGSSNCHMQSVSHHCVSDERCKVVPALWTNEESLSSHLHQQRLLMLTFAQTM